MTPKTLNDETVFNAMVNAAKLTYEETCKAPFTEAPSKEIKTLIEYDGKMRISGMEKFNGPTVISFVNFYLNDLDKKGGKACGAVVIYYENEMIPKLMKGFKGVSFDEDDENALKEVCGELASVLATNFKNELGRQGYLALLTSAPSSFINTVPGGISFSYDQYEKVEVNFSFWRKKAVVVDVTLTQVPGK